MEAELEKVEQFTLVVAGVTYLLPKYCPHRGGHLACGYVNAKAGRITCPLHGATFELRSGKRLAGPVCPDLTIRVVEIPERL